MTKTEFKEKRDEILADAADAEEAPDREASPERAHAALTAAVLLLAEVIRDKGDTHVTLDMPTVDTERTRLFLREGGLVNPPVGN